MSGASTRVTEPRDHVVQFYEHDEQLVDPVGAYLADGLRIGEAALVVATAAHRQAFDAWLGDSGIDVARAVTDGTVVFLDAADTLARLLVDGEPDAAAFDAVVGTLVRRLGADGRPVRVYGEMVALLWDEGQVQSAFALESLWNGLAGAVDFTLFCAYRSQPAGDELDHVCRLHSAVVGGDVTERFAWEPQAARAARRFVTDTLRRWRYDGEVVDDAAMVVTELVTNVLVHARSDTAVAVSTRYGAVRIAVRDDNLRVPVPREHGPDSASGRGMALVAAMAERWGVDPVPDGKVVWAELRAAQTP